VADRFAERVTLVEDDEDAVTLDTVPEQRLVGVPERVRRVSGW
jgi:hypothetical protein